jgi:hypothetical protein
MGWYGKKLSYRSPILLLNLEVLSLTLTNEGDQND